MNIFARLVKAEEQKDGTLKITGRATQELPDKANEICDYETSVPHFKAWSAEFEKVTDGKSVGNLRAMHGSVAAGKLTSLIFNDAEKAIDIEAVIVDANEVKKTLEGVNTGLSIGGSYGKKWEDTTDKKLTRYEAIPKEISLVDSPCLPSARFTIQKADGTTEEKDLVGKREFSDTERDKAADKGQALPDGSFPIKNKEDLKNAVKAYGRAKDKGKAKAHIIKRAKALGATDELPDSWSKGSDKMDALILGLQKIETKEQYAEVLKKYQGEEIYDVGNALSALQLISYLAIKEAGELHPEAEDQNNSLLGAIDNLKQFIASEIMEDNSEDNMLMADKVGALMKGEGTPEEQTAFTKMLEDAGFVLLKSGARHSKADMDKIQTIHDHAASLGADCSASKSVISEDLQKRESEQLQKIETLSKEITYLSEYGEIFRKKADAYDALPAPAKGFAANPNLAPLITKENDTPGSLSLEKQAQAEALEKRIKEATTEQQRESCALDLMKMIHGSK